MLVPYRSSGSERTFELVSIMLLHMYGAGGLMCMSRGHKVQHPILLNKPAHVPPRYRNSPAPFDKQAWWWRAHQQFDVSSRFSNRALIRHHPSGSRLFCVIASNSCSFCRSDER